jgi:hypothetical protein
VVLHPVRGRTILVAPIRLALGCAWYAAARVAGAAQASTLLAFGSGLVAFVFLAFNDPRMSFVVRNDPAPAPADATIASPLAQALRATLPSTVGVTVLAAIAVVPYPVLAAFLGGVSAGLGVGALASVPRIDPALLLDPRSGVVYHR